MLALLINLLILFVILAVVWYIFTLIPIPEPFRWIGSVIVLLAFLVLLVSLLTGSFTFYGPVMHPVIRG